MSLYTDFVQCRACQIPVRATDVDKTTLEIVYTFQRKIEEVQTNRGNG